jgi:hypothetical protein
MAPGACCDGPVEFGCIVDVEQSLKFWSERKKKREKREGKIKAK